MEEDLSNVGHYINFNDPILMLADMGHGPGSENLSFPLLLQQVAMGDQQAFRQLHHLFFRRLFQFALSLVRTKENAEEIVEDVFIKLWNQRESIGKINDLKVYLYTATRNTALNYLSKKARESMVESFDHIDILLAPTELSPEQIMITAEMNRKIRAAIESLPPRCKMIFKLIREDGLKYKEVAGILHITVNTIDAQMAIAVKRIADAIRKDFTGGPVSRVQKKS